MESLSHPHWGALTPLTIRAFHRWVSLSFINKFYLAGGSELALHLGHRFSIDVDFFSPDSSAVGADQRNELQGLLEDPSLAIMIGKDRTFAATGFYHDNGCA